MTDATTTSSASSPSRRPRVVTLGETMGMISSTQPGPLAHASTMQLGIGGSESNVAIGLSRLGVDAIWFGRVGDDSVGRLVAREVRAEGVDARITIDDGATTGLMIKERRTATSQNVTYYRAGSAGSRLSADDLDESAIASADVLHVTGITPALSGSAAQAVRRAADVARAAGVLVSFDVNYRRALWSTDDAAAFCREFAAGCDVLFAGEDEAAMLLGPAATASFPTGAAAGGAADAASDATAALARGLAELGPRQAVVKCGAAGAVAMVDGQLLEQRAVPIVAHDTVGAGDAFVAGYLAELAAGNDAPTRLQTAATVGAFVCLAAGDWEGLPRRSELGLLHAREAVTR
ncbi:sugar kinase [Frigoribacterium sp. PvP032]|uniref:sugar kinase n=1 Tax=Frigoribacterium sp. PvP032 TaxID=2806589 RepID=UPI001AE5283F|nr:sugar kinase [Frigoribacterium sp. PvP032]MBP1189948.1 2-dehydro-3-deoxygluconokinase [Frigoribacterium sp. PvP032]